MGMSGMRREDGQLKYHSEDINGQMCGGRQFWLSALWPVMAKKWFVKQSDEI